MISQATIASVKEATRIEDVIAERVTLKKEGPRLKGLCPFHNEKTPSFTVTPAKQLYYCHGCKESGDVFTFVMKTQQLTYPQAVKLLAEKAGIQLENDKGATIDPELCKPEIRYRNAEPDEVEGSWSFARTAFTEATARYVLAPKVWEYLLITAKRTGTDVNKEFTAEEKAASALDKAAEVFAAYHFHSLSEYSIVKGGKVTTIRATEHFPIYLFDEIGWQKIYKPMEPEKGKRFMYHGTRPRDFVHGEAALIKAHALLEKKYQEENENGKDESDSKKRKPETRVPEAILCSGGSDGLNLAMLGHYPLWLNSESATISEGMMKRWQVHAQKIYNLPDLDRTGTANAHKLAMEHLDICTIWLPEALKTKYVARGFGKDARDYFRFWTHWDFLKLLKTAYPYRFWDTQPKFNKQGVFTGMGYHVRTKYLLNFLERNGFYRFKAENEKDGYIYIRIQQHIVTKIEAKDVRDYVNRFIEDRKLDAELMDTFLRTTQLNESTLSNLSFREIDFADHDAQTQWMFFENTVLKVTATGVEEYAPADCDKFVWADEVLMHDVEALPDLFTINADGEKGPTITIHEKECMVLNYLVNASRMFWRDELETRVEGISNPEERDKYVAAQGFSQTEIPLALGLPKEQWEKYRTENKWNIAGPLLTENESLLQQLHLINKIYSLGYLLHRHKNSSRAWCVWAMDAKLADVSESHGGSGKSLSIKVLQAFMRSEYFEGRNAKITDNPHIFGNVTRHTDLLFIDDCSQYLPFDFFFPSITGPMNCNPKHGRQYTIQFAEVGKMAFASNYSPYRLDPSGERRILYMSFSDYYHYNKLGEYREERRVYDDFGRNLIDDFRPQDWNHTANFLAQCVRFYLSHPDKVNPPMESVNKRNLKAEMGDVFHAWMDAYMADDNRYNTFMVRDEMFELFRTTTRQNLVTPQKFLKAVKAWCHYNNSELNPKEMLNGQGRIIQKHKETDKDGTERTTTKEMFYIRKNTTPTPETAPAKAGDDEPLPF